MSLLLLAANPSNVQRYFMGIDYATDYRSTSIVYAGDYTAVYTERSLVDKVYVNQLISDLTREQRMEQKELDIYNNELCQYILN